MNEMLIMHVLSKIVSIIIFGIGCFILNIYITDKKEEKCFFALATGLMLLLIAIIGLLEEMPHE